MSHSTQFRCIAASLQVTLVMSTASEFAQAQAEPREDFMLCNVYDHEIFEDVLAYQVPIDETNIETSLGELFIARVRPVPNPATPPYTAESVFREAPFQKDTDLPPLLQSLNGPEIGFDETVGFEVAYTKVGTGDNWYHARLANDCVIQMPGCWLQKDFVNAPSGSNRWNPFVTQNADGAATAVYFRTPGSRDAQRRLALRPLEESLAEEVVISDPNAFSGTHRWARIDSKDYIVTTYGQGTGTDDVDIVLYDSMDTSFTPINITATRAGKRGDGWIGFDPAPPPSGRYTLVDVKTDIQDSTKVSIEVWQQTAPNAWTFQYEFNAATAGDSGNPYVQSPELFSFGNHLYIAFVTSDQANFVSSTRGTVRITRIEADDSDPSDNHYRLLTTAENLVKRTEPEVHYVGNGGTHIPVIFYTQEAGVGDEDCPDFTVPINKLMRATTGYLWQD
jgi:hypothetical protein